MARAGLPGPGSAVTEPAAGRRPAPGRPHAPPGRRGVLPGAHRGVHRGRARGRPAGERGASPRSRTPRRAVVGALRAPGRALRACSSGARRDRAGPDRRRGPRGPRGRRGARRRCGRGSPTPRSRVVTVTVTEAGYRHDPVTRRLRARRPGLAGGPGGRRTARGRPPRRPVSATGRARGRRAVGARVRQRRRRRRRCSPGSSRSSAPARRGALADWVAEHVRFPSTVVDRIVPAPREPPARGCASASGGRRGGRGHRDAPGSG